MIDHSKMKHNGYANSSWVVDLPWKRLAIYEVLKTQISILRRQSVPAAIHVLPG